MLISTLASIKQIFQHAILYAFTMLSKSCLGNSAINSCQLSALQDGPQAFSKEEISRINEGLYYYEVIF